MNILLLVKGVFLELSSNANFLSFFMSSSIIAETFREDSDTLSVFFYESGSIK